MFKLIRPQLEAGEVWLAWVAKQGVGMPDMISRHAVIYLESLPRYGRSTALAKLQELADMLNAAENLPEEQFEQIADKPDPFRANPN